MKKRYSYPFKHYPLHIPVMLFIAYSIHLSDPKEKISSYLHPRQIASPTLPKYLQPSSNNYLYLTRISHQFRQRQVQNFYQLTTVTCVYC